METNPPMTDPIDLTARRQSLTPREHEERRAATRARIREKGGGTRRASCVVVTLAGKKEGR